MNILVVNGSPKGKRSNTLHITQAFLAGMNRYEKQDISWFTVADKHLEYCEGCLFCWSNPKGQCVHKDDMAEFNTLYDEADMVIFSAPVFAFGVPAMMKNIFDRMIYRRNPKIHKRDQGREFHGSRWAEKDKQFVLISTFGFYSYEHNVEPVLLQFDIMFGENSEKIVSPEGALYSIPPFDEKTKPYLDAAEKAGYAMAETGCIPPELHEALKKPAVAINDYLNVVNGMLSGGYWRPHTVSGGQQETKNELLIGRLYQMAAIPDISGLTDEETVIEFAFPDTGLSAQLIYTKNGCTVVSEEADLRPYHLKIHMGSTVFMNLGPVRKMVDGKWVSESPKKVPDMNKLLTLAESLRKNRLKKEIHF